MGVQVLVTLLTESLPPPRLPAPARAARGPPRPARPPAPGRYGRKAVPQSDSIIKYPERDLDALCKWRAALQPDSQLRVLIADDSFFTPGLLPSAVGGGSIYTGNGGVAGLRLAREVEPQIRRREHRMTKATDVEYREPLPCLKRRTHLDDLPGRLGALRVRSPDQPRQTNFCQDQIQPRGR